jgi:hypothetical protein
MQKRRHQRGRRLADTDNRILLDSISVTSRSGTSRFNASAAKYPAVPPPDYDSLGPGTFARSTSAVAAGDVGAKRSATALAA